MFVCVCVCVFVCVCACVRVCVCACVRASAVCGYHMYVLYSVDSHAIGEAMLQVACGSSKEL